MFIAIRNPRTIIARIKPALLYVGLPAAVVMAAAIGARAYDGAWIGNGKPLSSVALKKDLDEMDTRIRAFEATFVGGTDAKFNGNMKTQVPTAPNGYAAATALCRVQYPKTAHICSASEILRYLSSGGSSVALNDLWYASGVRKYYYIGNTNEPADDCNGWTSSNPGVQGSFWQSPGGYPGNNNCDTLFAIACCN